MQVFGTLLPMKNWKLFLLSVMLPEASTWPALVHFKRVTCVYFIGESWKLLPCFWLAGSGRGSDGPRGVFCHLMTAQPQKRPRQQTHSPRLGYFGISGRWIFWFCRWRLCGEAFDAWLRRLFLSFAPTGWAVDRTTPRRSWDTVSLARSTGRTSTTRRWEQRPGALRLIDAGGVAIDVLDFTVTSGFFFSSFF